jgi:hypothetical protein
MRATIWNSRTRTTHSQGKPLTLLRRPAAHDYATDEFSGIQRNSQNFQFSFGYNVAVHFASCETGIVQTRTRDREFRIRITGKAWIRR